MAIEVSVSTTPNENAMKYTLNCNSIESGHKTYANAAAAENSPVAKALFTIDGVSQVFLMADFISVTKKPEAAWSNLEASILEAIKSSY
ncbi:MAG: NifU N-terminal domain-containing protein [Nitrospinota bacterium]|nr:NifU N-terminal domain-containing protein [Nitrospinota bacterium]